MGFWHYRTYLCIVVNFTYVIRLTTYYMSSDQSPICPNCTAWMLDHPTLSGWLKCVSCGYCCKIMKRIVTPVGHKEKKNGLD